MPHPPNPPNLSGLREGGAPPPPELPRDLWFAILAAVDTEDPCEEVGKLCDVNKETAALCRNSLLYDEANKRLGWYGPYRTWAEVLQFYTAKGEPWATAARRSTPMAYFQKVCKERREIVDLLVIQDNAVYDFHYQDDRHWHAGSHLVPHEWLFERQWRNAIAQRNQADDRLEDKIESIGLHPYAEYLIKFTVQIDGDALKHLPGSIYTNSKNESVTRLPAMDNYNEIAKLALQQNPNGAFFSLDPNRADYGELAHFAVQLDGRLVADVPDDRPDYHTIVAHAPPEDYLAGRSPRSWWERETKTFPDWAPQTKFARHILEAARITELVNTMPMAASAAL